MIKNADILARLDQKNNEIEKSGKWYKKADALYETAMSLNPEAVKKGGQAHVEMLINVSKKMKFAKNQMPSAE